MIGSLAFAIWLKVCFLQMSQQVRLILTSFHLLRMRSFFFQYPWGLNSYYKTYVGINEEYAILQKKLFRAGLKEEERPKG